MVILPYGPFLIAACFVGLGLYLWSAKNKPLALSIFLPSLCLSVLLAVLAEGQLGTALAQHQRSLIVGTLILFGAGFAMRAKVNVWGWLDQLLPALLAYLSIEQLGTFFGGQDFGIKLRSGDWGVHYPPPTPAFAHYQAIDPWLANQGHTYALHPVQLYVSLCLLLGVVFAIRFRGRFKRGQLAAYCLIYGSAVLFFLATPFRVQLEPHPSVLVMPQFWGAILIVFTSLGLWISKRSAQKTQIVMASSKSKDFRFKGNPRPKRRRKR